MRKFYALFLFALFSSTSAFSQTTGDYRISGAGFSDWTADNWDRWNGSEWVSGIVGPATIPSGNTVTILAGGAPLLTTTVTNNGTLVINDQLYIFGGTLINTGTVTNTGTFQLASGSYTHNRNGGSFPASGQFDLGSTVNVQGVTTTKPGNFPTSVGHLVVNCSGLSSALNISEGTTVQNDLTVTHTGSSSVNFVGGTGVVLIKGNLSIETNGKVIIENDCSVSVEGTTANTTNANFVIQSNSSGTGSFICNSSPNGTLQSYLSAGDWHLVGPPNNSLKAADAFLTGYMQTWADGDPGGWTAQEGDPALTRGRGAAYYFVGNFTAGMYGTIGGNAETESGLGNAGGADDGYHLLANPFACSVDLDLCTFSGSMSSTYQTYNGSSYTTMAGNVMPASQAFFVQVNNGATGQSVTFNTGAKIHSNLNVLKKTNETDLVQFSLTDNIGMSNDELIIRFNENASFSYDPQYDGHKIVGNVKAGEIQAQITDSEFACVLGIPFPTENSLSVKVDFKKGDASEYTLELKRNLLNNIEVTLEDTYTGFITDLSANPIYTFTSEESISGRFLVHFKTATAIEESMDFNLVKIWNFRDQLYVQNDIERSSELFIYDISGKQVFSRKLEAIDLQVIDMNLPKGTYLVNLVSDSQSFSTKIIK